MKPETSRDLNIRCWSLRDKELYLNRGEDDIKGPHAYGSKSTIDREASGSGPGPKQAQAGRPSPFSCRFTMPFDLCAPLPPPAATSIHSLESRRHEGEASGGSRRLPQVLELPRRWPRPCLSHHGWPYVVKPWWSSGAHALIPSRQLYILHLMVI
jgi:hypothetical protein